MRIMASTQLKEIDISNSVLKVIISSLNISSESKGSFFALFSFIFKKFYAINFPK